MVPLYEIKYFLIQIVNKQYDIHTLHFDLFYWIITLSPEIILRRIILSLKENRRWSKKIPGKPIMVANSSVKQLEHGI